MDKVTEFLDFETLVTPSLIRALFVGFLVIWVLLLVAAMVLDIEDRGLTILILLVAPIVVRIYLEGLIVRYLVYEELQEITRTISEYGEDALDQMREGQ